MFEYLLKKPPSIQIPPLNSTVRRTTAEPVRFCIIYSSMQTPTSQRVSSTSWCQLTSATMRRTVLDSTSCTEAFLMKPGQMQLNWSSTSPSEVAPWTLRLMMSVSLNQPGNPTLSVNCQAWPEPWIFRSHWQRRLLVSMLKSARQVAAMMLRYVESIFSQLSFLDNHNRIMNVLINC